MITIVKMLSFVTILSIIIAFGLLGPILSNIAHKVSFNVIAL